MAGLSCVIKNAKIVDGTGRPAFAGAVGVAGARIAAVGSVEGAECPMIDAGGKVLAPGFIDLHTHYDPQLCWDRLATPSPAHGVTSLVVGNCSVTLAPVHPRHHTKLIALFGSVEDMEARLLENTVPFSWETFPEYAAYLKEGLGPNVGAFIGQSVLRLYVMGEDASKRTATDSEIAEMAAVLRESLRAGALGLSFTYVHYDETGVQMPCAFADDREIMALYRVMAEEGRGIVEAAPYLTGTPEDLMKSIDNFGRYALENGVTTSLSPILHVPVLGNLWLRMLTRLQEWQSRGAPLYMQTQVRPFDSTMQLSKGSFTLSKTMEWRRVLELPVDQRVAAFADPKLRPVLNTEVTPNARAAVTLMTVRRPRSPENQKYEGRRLTEIAEAEGKTVIDTMLDIAVRDNLDTEFVTLNVTHADPATVGMLLTHKGIHIGSGDAGAHINQFAGAGDTTYLFEKFVRQEQVMTLEHAVQRLTSDIARGWNIVDRGEIAPGKFADLVIFDPDTIARGDEKWVEDVPGDNGRYIREPSGIDKVIVNGQVLVDQGKYTDARPGMLI